jgi:GTP cyclohydrolase III
MRNWKGFEWKWSWPNGGTIPTFALRTTTKNLSQIAGSQSENRNEHLTKYKSATLLLKQSVRNIDIVARCAPVAATVQVLGVNLLLTATCHESWCP